MFQKCTILGSGAMATACSILLAENEGMKISIWGRNEEYTTQFQKTRENRRQLPGITIPEQVEVTSDIAQAMDGTEMDILRVVALQQLRNMGKGARSGDVVRSMIDLAQGTEDAKIRADVWRNMHRAADRQLIDPMIQALTHDTDANVREGAAESLGFFLDVPRAKAALEHAMRNDAARGVRREAERSLDGRNR